ncbi:MAG: pilus assembly protein [Deltaproteobacteria bacterium]|nr:pilus assembly protein [Deltaproteobacteria bacterium]
MKFGKSCLRICKNKKGAAVVEFAIAGLLFFTVLFSILDWALLSFINLTMQHAVREGTRYVVTGQDGIGGTWNSNPDSRYLYDDRFRAMVEKIKSQSMGFFDTVILNPGGDIEVEDVSGNDIKSQFEYDFNGDGDTDDTDEIWNAYVPGNPGEIIVVKLNCTWTLLTPFIGSFFTNGEYNFTVASTMKNEMF